MAEARDDRHRYGQHYTPHEVARLLAAFAVRMANDLVFDPSCGDGRLLEQSLQIKRFRSLQNKQDSAKLIQEVFGIDRSPLAVCLASGAIDNVATMDFFDIEPRASLNKTTMMPAEFDAIIGNPPYIRQEVMGACDKRRIEKRLESDRRNSPDVYWPQWSGRSDIYVYFFARSIRFLKAGGRLVFLTASSWLDSGYGTALQDFLLNNFRVIAVIESATESFFADASINTSIAVLAREPNAHARETNLVRFVQLVKPLNGIFNREPVGGDAAIELARTIEHADSSVANDAYRIRAINQAELMNKPTGAPSASHKVAGASWSRYLRADDIFFRVLERGNNRLRHLSDLARVRFGVKTGANDFFYVKGGELKEKVDGGLLTLSDIASVRRGLTTGANDFFYLSQVKERATSLTVVRSATGTEHTIESKYLSPVIFSLKEIPGILLESNRTGKLFFNCPAARKDLVGTKALDYILSGELVGYDRRPTCSARAEWYRVARGMKPAPLIFPSKVGERWLVALNRALVFEDKKLYGIFPRQNVPELVLTALLNSTWARYYSEMTCRQMTGAQAIADIDVAVAERIMIPDPRGLSVTMRKKIESAIKAIARRPVLSIFEEVKRADRRRLDELTLAAIGFADKAERRDALDQLYQAMTKLVRARIDKSKK